MEPLPQNSPDLSRVVNSLTSHNINLVLAFLDNDTIISLISAGGRRPTEKCPLIPVAANRLFVLDYLHRTDRSIYMPFYSQPHFLIIENEQLFLLTTKHAAGLHILATSTRSLLRRLQQELSDFEFAQEALESVVQSLTDPELPFPKLRKQDIGRHCNSAFQYFLVDQLFPNSVEEEQEEAFQELNRFLSQRWTLSVQTGKQELEIIEEVFTRWYRINYDNYQEYLLAGNRHHNLVVLVVALLDLFVDSNSFYVQSIQDPLYAFTEFNLRFCIFRNTLLSLEEKLGFLFKSYSRFCRQLPAKWRGSQMQPEGNENEQSRGMTIWHCGLSKWYIYMQQLHQSNIQTYFYLLKKTNLMKLKEENYQKMPQDETFIELQNRLDLREFELLERSRTFEVHSPIEDIFDENPELYNQTLQEYIEYLVDISINQYSVHWCGHSSHVLHIPYQEFDRNVVDHYFSYINNIEQIAKAVSNPQLALDSMMKSMIEQLDREYLKPVTLKKIIQYAQSRLRAVPGERQQEELDFMGACRDISLEMSGRDKVLEHFNGNADISNEVSYKYSIVLQNEDFTKLLKISASTNASIASRGRQWRLRSIKSSQSILEGDFA